MASIQLTLKDNSIITRLKRQRQEASLSSITHLLRQPGLTVKKTTPNTNLNIVNIGKRTAQKRTAQKRALNFNNQKGTANNIGEKSTASSTGEKRTSNNNEVKTTNVIDDQNSKNIKNIGEKTTAYNIGEKSTANYIGEKRTSNNNEVKTINDQNKNKNTSSNNETKTLYDVFKKKPFIPKIGTKFTFQNIKPISNKRTATKKQNKEQNKMGEDKEFYPEKVKRKILLKKIILKPKHDYKVVASTNKRKRCTPIRDTTSTKRFKPSSPITDINDEMFFNDEMMINDDLTDEDLMEILTCESPVWWEQLPDGVDEEPIGRQSPSSSNTSLLTENSPQSLKTTEPLPRNTDTGQNKQMKEKQNKLERLLNNIREMKVKVKENEIKSLTQNEIVETESRSRKHSTDSSDISICDDDLIKCLESVEIPIKTINLDNNELEKDTKSRNLCEKDIKNDDPVIENSSKNKDDMNLKNKNLITIENDAEIPILEIEDDPIEETFSKNENDMNLTNNEIIKSNIKVMFVVKDAEMPILEIEDDPMEENSYKNEDNMTLKNNEKENYKTIQSNTKVIFVVKDVEMPILEIEDDPIEENSSKNKNNMNLKKYDEEISITKIPPLEIIDAPVVVNVEDNQIKHKVKEILIEKNTKKPIVEITDKPLVEIFLKNKNNTENNEITKNNLKQQVLVKKDAVIPILELEKNYRIMQNSSKNKSNINFESNELSNKNINVIAVENDTKIRLLEPKCGPVVDNSTNNKRNMNCKNYELKKNKDKAIFIRKASKIRLLETKDSPAVEDSSKNNFENNELQNKNDSIENFTKIRLLKTKDGLVVENSTNNEKNMNCKNTELKKDKDKAILIKKESKTPIEDIKKCTFIESFSSTLELSIEKPTSVKDTNTPNPDLNNDDFENEICKNLIETKINKNDETIKEFETEDDPIEGIPIFCINKNETTSPVKKPDEKVVKKRRNTCKKSTVVQYYETPEFSNYDCAKFISVDKNNHNVFKKDAQTAILLLKTYETIPTIETEEEIPSTSKINVTNNLNQQTKIKENVLNTAEKLNQQIKIAENIQNTAEKLPSPRKLSPKKNLKRSLQKIKITKFYDSLSNRPNIVRKKPNRFYVRNIQSQNSDDNIEKTQKVAPKDENTNNKKKRLSLISLSNRPNIVRKKPNRFYARNIQSQNSDDNIEKTQKVAPKDENTNNKKKRLNLIRQHYLELLNQRSNELLNMSTNANKAISINDKNTIIDKETTTDSNIESNDDFCIQNTSIKFDNESKSYTNTNEIHSSINLNNMKADSSININSRPRIRDTNTEDKELGIDIKSTNSNNNINLDSINCNSTKISEIPLNLPKLIKIPNAASPISIKSINSDSPDENYTISDSNVTYIDEYDDRDKSDDLVTVYKILSRPENSDKMQYLNVPGGNMKYCYNCSTIFETENCLYCVKKSIENSGS